VSRYSIALNNREREREKEKGRREIEDIVIDSK